MRYIWVIVLVIIALNIGCKKTPNIYKITGNVKHKSLGESLSGVKVYLDAKQIQNGTYNANFVNIKVTNTDASGGFSMEIEDSQVSDYRFRVSETGYYNIEEEVSVNKVHSTNGYTKNFELVKISWIELNVKNTMPQSVDDKITYRYSNIEVKGRDCCNNNVVTGDGFDYEAHHKCSVRDHAWIYLYWTVTKNGNQSIHNDSIYSGNGETVIYNLNY